MMPTGAFQWLMLRPIPLVFMTVKNMGRDYYNGHCVCEDVKKFLRSTNYIKNIPACEWQLQYSETPQQTD